MLQSKNRTHTEGVSFINNEPLGYPDAIRISKNVGCKHFIIRFTAITVAPLVILMCAPYSYLSIYVLMFLQSCPIAASQSVTAGGR